MEKATTDSPLKPQRFNWNNLLKNLCPKCGDDLMNGLEKEAQPENNFKLLLIHPCGFKIRENRYQEIVNSMLTQRTERNYEG